MVRISSYSPHGNPRVGDGQSVRLDVAREYHRGSPAERFWARVDQGPRPDDCWGWRGSRDRKGYARLGVTGRKVVLAHRFSWCIHQGPIPDGMCVLHSCDNPPCTNPQHLFLGTRVDNNEDMRSKGRANSAGVFSADMFAISGHPRAKLTWDDVDQIRTSYAPRQVTRRMLATKFGVSEAAVKAIVEGRAWNPNSRPRMKA
jgi:hypothetical protein